MKCVDHHEGPGLCPRCATWSEWHGLRFGFTYGLWNDGSRMQTVLLCEVPMPDPWRRAKGIAVVHRDIAKFPGGPPLAHFDALHAALLAAGQHLPEALVAALELKGRRTLPREVREADPHRWPTLN